MKAKSIDSAKRDISTESLLINLHIAEYQMLTSRCTNWLTLQFGLWSLFGISISIIVAAWVHFSTMHNILVWGSLTIAYSISTLFVLNMREYYLTVIYIESDLYKKITVLISKYAFWEYESFLKNKREDFFAKKMEYILPFLLTVALIFIVIWVSVCRVWDFKNILFLILNFCFCLYLWFRSKDIFFLRKKFSSQRQSYDNLDAYGFKSQHNHIG